MFCDLSKIREKERTTGIWEKYQSKWYSFFLCFFFFFSIFFFFFIPFQYRSFVYLPIHVFPMLIFGLWVPDSNKWTHFATREWTFFLSMWYKLEILDMKSILIQIFVCSFAFNPLIYIHTRVRYGQRFQQFFNVSSAINKSYRASPIWTQFHLQDYIKCTGDLYT